MATLLRCGSLLAAALLLASCGGSDPSVAASPSPSPSGTSPSPAASSTTAAATTVFRSDTYGYTVTLPPSWTSIQAQKAWDGKAVLSSDAAPVDQFPGTYTASSWVVAIPSSKTLAAFTAAMIAVNSRDHGDTCPARPESRQRVTIGGEPGVLLAYDCGILINLAATVHDGVGYQFGFRDPTVKAATDPTDHETFLAILESVQFPT